MWIILYKRVSLYRQRYEYYTSNKSALQDNELGLRPIGLIYILISYLKLMLGKETPTWVWKQNHGNSLEACLVNMSGNWSWEDTEQSCKVPCSKWWRTKWQSISICLVWLSQWIGTTVEQSMPRSWKSQRNQRSSVVVSASARYSTSVLERAIIDCFLLHQEMRHQEENNTL